MATEIEKVVGIALHTMVDLWGGTLIATGINTFFVMHDPPKNGTFPQYTDLWKTAAFASIQAIVTMLVAEEARNLIWNGGAEDPTAGIIFIVSLFIPQTSLWSKVASVYYMLVEEFSKSQGNSDQTTIPKQQ